MLALEAFLGGFYVAITRNMFVPMLSYHGYPTEVIARVTLLAGLLGVAISVVMYERPDLLTGNIKMLLLATYLCERILWLSLPFALGQPLLLSALYGVAQAVTIPVSVLMNYVLLTLFRGEEDFRSATIMRTAASNAASLLGLLFGVYMATYVEPPDLYQVMYITSFTAGLLGVLTLLPLHLSAEGPEPSGFRSSSREGAEMSGANAFLMLLMMNAGSSILGMVWAPLLRKLGAPLNIPILLSLLGSLGGTVGPYLWRNYKAYLLAMIANATTLGLLILSSSIWIHLVYSFVLSATFVGANMIGASIYSRYLRELGIVKASTLLAASTAGGTLLSSIIGMLVRGDERLALVVSLLFRLAAVAIVALAIPETALVPPEVAIGYARLVYSTSMMGYTFAIETSVKVLKLTAQLLAITILIVLTIIIYRLALLLY